MKGQHVMLVLTAFALAGCSSNPEPGEMSRVDSAAAAESPTTGVRGGGTNFDNSGHARIIVGEPKPVLIDGIEMRIPEDGIITLTNGTHRIQCSSHDIVIKVDYQPRPAPVIVNCRVP